MQATTIGVILVREAAFFFTLYYYYYYWCYFNFGDFKLLVVATKEGNVCFNYCSQYKFVT